MGVVGGLSRGTQCVIPGWDGDTTMKKLWAFVYAGLFLLAVVVAWYVLMHGVAMLEGLSPVFGGL